MDLGVCVSMEQGFGMETMIPVRHIGDGELSFCVFDQHNKQKHRLVTVSDNEPFPYISMLDDAVMVIDQEHKYICIQKDIN